MEAVIFALGIAAYLGIGFGWTTLRVWRRYGVWPVVFQREAAPSQRLMGLLSGLLLLAVAALGLLHVVIGPEVLAVRRVPTAARLIGFALMLFGTVLTIAAQRQMGPSWRIGIDDRPTDLVTDGVFRYVRNPIFAGLLAFLAGVTLLSLAWWSLGVLVVTMVVLRVQVRHEEEHLARLHGPAYLAYAARVGRFTPVTGRLFCSSATPWAAARKI